VGELFVGVAIGELAVGEGTCVDILVGAAVVVGVFVGMEGVQAASERISIALMSRDFIWVSPVWKYFSIIPRKGQIAK
jgi:hypothetical protein